MLLHQLLILLRQRLHCWITLLGRTADIVFIFTASGVTDIFVFALSRRDIGVLRHQQTDAVEVLTQGRFKSTHDKAAHVYCCVRNNCFSRRKLSHTLRLFLKKVCLATPITVS